MPVSMLTMGYSKRNGRMMLLNGINSLGLDVLIVVGTAKRCWRVIRYWGKMIVMMTSIEINGGEIWSFGWDRSSVLRKLQN
jgi:hypothetical protein